MELGRIIIMLRAEKVSLVRPRWLTVTFVTGDVLSFLMQASGMLKYYFIYKTTITMLNLTRVIGAGLMIANSSNPSNGEHVIIGGLFVQIIFFGFFMVTSIIFDLRLLRNPTQASSELSFIWRRHLSALYATSILILIRSVVRVVEYMEGYQGYVMTHEAFIYVFDALLMFVVMLIMIYIHPSQINCLIGRSERFFQKAFYLESADFATVELQQA